MRDRLTLQTELEMLLGNGNVYFQPPAEVKMRYPAIRYKMSDIDNTYANNRVYASQKQYELILIDKDPDSEYVDKLNQFYNASFVRAYIADNLNHWVFTINY